MNKSIGTTVPRVPSQVIVTPSARQPACSLKVTGIRSVCLNHEHCLMSVQSRVHVQCRKLLGQHLIVGSKFTVSACEVCTYDYPYLGDV